VARQSGSGQLAGFGYSVRTRFARCNHPWQTKWRAGGENVNYYRIDVSTAEKWHTALGAQAREDEHDSQESQSVEAAVEPLADTATTGSGDGGGD
jgi:hypothetical protein